MKDPIEYLNSLPMFGSGEGFKPGLTRVNRLLSKSGFAEEELNFIHVAGSNGKGSVIAMLAAIYQQAGLSVGRYISPHIVGFTERISVSGQFISKEELGRELAKLKPLLAEKALWHDTGEPTFFEVVTALALLYFSTSRPDIVLLETGLGGRLDATNVIDNPLISVITTIDLEHTKYLGDSIAEIAREKAGIIKESAPVITGESKEQALKEIRRIAKNKGASYFWAGHFFAIQRTKNNVSGQHFKFLPGTQEKNFNWQPEIYTEEEFFLPLSGDYQLDNVKLACAVTALLQDKFSVSTSDIKKGLPEIKWPGRLEIIRQNPPIIIDGSHTPAGIKYLQQFLKEHFANQQKITILLAVLEDKNLPEILAALAPLASLSADFQVILTQSSSVRAFKAKDFSAEEKDWLTVDFSSSLWELLLQLLSQQKDKDLVCLTGSLYNLQEVREKLIDFLN